MYMIKKVDHRIHCMKDTAWEQANVADVTCINWEEFSWCPKTQAKILYSDYGLHIQLQTDEKDLVATYRTQNSAVCDDSCMEFFFRPNENDKRYFNFEFNPFGTMYFGFRYDRYDYVNPEEDKQFFEVKSYVDENLWTVQFTVPFAYIENMVGGYTKNMFGNIYKCASGTDHEHYATYYPVKTEHPDYHLPETFGAFVLE